MTRILVTGPQCINTHCAFCCHESSVACIHLVYGMLVLFAFLFCGVLTAGELLYCGCPIAKSAQDCVKYGVVCNCVAVIYLVVVPCFLVHVEFFHSIQHTAFLCGV
jgi:hypothetical protein